MTDEERSYRDNYNKGWRYASTSDSGLDGPDRRGLTSRPGWMDGYADQSQGFPKHHRRDCDAPHHDECFDKLLTART